MTLGFYSLDLVRDGRLGESQHAGNLLARGLGGKVREIEIFWKKVLKVKEENFYP